MFANKAVSLHFMAKRLFSEGNKNGQYFSLWAMIDGTPGRKRRVHNFFSARKKAPKHKHFHYSVHNSQNPSRIPISYGSLTLLIVIFIFCAHRYKQFHLINKQWSEIECINISFTRITVDTNAPLIPLNISFQ